MGQAGRHSREDGTPHARWWTAHARWWTGRVRRPSGISTIFWSVALICGLSSTGVALASGVGSSAPSSPARPQARPQAVTAAPRLPHGAHALGAVSATAPVSGAVALKLRDPAAVQRFIASVSNPRSPSYHHYLSKGQFAQRFGPTQQSIASVEAQLSSAGLHVTGVSANRILVHFSGPADRVEAAFGTRLERVRLANGSIGRATTSAAKVPHGVASRIQAVVGLNQLVHDKTGIERPTKLTHRRIPSVAQPRATGGGPTACADAKAANTAGALTDQQIATSYGLNPLYQAGDLGAGQMVDIYEQEPFDISDVRAFDQCYFGRDNTSNIHLINVDGGPEAGPGSGEAALDVENVAGFAPDASIHVFQGPLTSLSGIDILQAMASADDARQISSSWGLCETAVQNGSPGQQQVENELFQQMAAQGQSFFASAGDDGSDDCAGHGVSPVPANLSVDDPGSQPYAVSVGGTTITRATQPPVESTWNNGATGGAGGGGVSESWGMPSWQSAAAVPQTTATQACSDDPAGGADDYHLAGFATTLPPGTACREVPDVSAVADPQTGITIYYTGQWLVIGGTSSAAPMWAAMNAEMNASSYCGSASQPKLGFVSPLLYQAAASSPSDYANAFDDITSGNNDNLSVGSATDYPAGPGYDMASGLGTPRITNQDGSPGLAQQLCRLAAAATTTQPLVTSMSATSGPVGGGGTTTIAGNNFGSSQGSVYFGTVQAHVTAWSNSSITVEVPAYSVPPQTPAGSAGRAIVTVVTAAMQSSPPGASSIYEYRAGSSGKPVVDFIANNSGPSAGGPNGPTAGGNTVEIIGSGLSGATSVKFGGASATIDSAATNSDNRLQVTVPAQPSSCSSAEASQGVCQVAVTVSTPAGTSSGPAILPAYQGPIVFGEDGSFGAPAGCGCEVVPQSEEYDYAPAPHISATSPAYVDEGGTSIATITGTGFNLLTYEYTDIGPADQNISQDLDLQGISPTTLTIGVSPDPNQTTQPDPAELTVLAGGQQSNRSTITYAGIPTLSSISTHLVSQSDPGNLTITGSGLSDVNAVVFSDQADLGFGYSVTSQITNQTSTRLTVAIPSFFAIPTDVMLCTVTGCSDPDPRTDTLVFAYPGQPGLTSSRPARGSSSGGTEVTIEGILDSEITAVRFGRRRAKIVSEPIGSPSGEIQVIAPWGKPRSKVHITITTKGGQLVGAPTSPITPSATFTYGGPQNFALRAPQVSRQGTLTFRVRAPSAGRFRVRAVTTLPHPNTAKGRRITYGQASLKAKKAGVLSLVVKPWRAARRALARGERLKVRVKVTFYPQHGSRVTHRRTVTVRGHRKG